MKTFLSQLSMYWHTIRYLRLIQIIGRIKYQFKKTKIDKSPSGNLRNINGKWIKSPRRNQSMFSYNSFNFLNETHQIESKSDWNKNSCSKLWLYNLHYFDDLNAINSEQRIKWHRELIDRWVMDNPPGEGCGWESYPISLRIVNWIKWSFSDNELHKSLLDSLSIQARYLFKNLEIHLMGNHLFANAKALLFAGIFFDNKEAKSWKNTAQQIIKKELSEQILDDGGNFELSPMYHTIFLEDILDIINLHNLYGIPIPNLYTDAANSMYKWFLNMCHPDEKLSFFNDCAFSVTPAEDEIKNYSLNLIESIVLSENSTPRNSYTDLPNSGYSIVRMNNMVAIIDRAPIGPDYLPGHAHADSLSFEFSLFNKRVIVNSGISVYEDCSDRHYQRSTAAHSTVVIDGKNSSEVWSSFRVARRAKIHNRSAKKTANSIKISASHDGYKRLPGSPIHSREWFFEKDSLIVTDEITGTGFHKIESILPLHPNIILNSLKNNKATLKLGDKYILIEVIGKGIFKDFKSHYHPEFGVSINNIKLIYTCTKALPVKIITRINW